MPASDSRTRLPLASATVSSVLSNILERTVTSAPLPMRYCAPAPSRAVERTAATCTVIAPPSMSLPVDGIWPDLEIAEESTVRLSAATVSPVPADTVPLTISAAAVWFVTAMHAAMPAAVLVASFVIWKRP